jgi:hypothetical protein
MNGYGAEFRQGQRRGNGRGRVSGATAAWRAVRVVLSSSNEARSATIGEKEQAGARREQGRARRSQCLAMTISCAENEREKSRGRRSE